MATARGVSPAQIALAWLLSKPAVAAPIVGATKLHHLEDAIGALDVQLNAEEIKQLEAPYRPHPVPQATKNGERPASAGWFCLTSRLTPAVRHFVCGCSENYS